MYIKLVHRNSLSVEANVKRFPNGDLGLICTCDGVKEPAIENQVYLFRSHDNGLTWEPREKLNQEDGWAHYMTEVSVFGDTVKVYITKHNGNFMDWQNYCLVSKDNGMTWRQEETPCLPSFGFTRGGIQLSNGRIVYPYHFFPVTQEQNEYCKKNNLLVLENKLPYIDNGIIVSDDDGKSFRKILAVRSDMDVYRQTYQFRWIWNENTVVELEPGHLVMLYRMDMTGYLWRTDSYDYGDTWSKASITDIPNPANKPFLIKTKKGEIVLLNTPVSQNGLIHRNPLEIWVSDDNMKSWYKKVPVSNLPGMYSYPAGFADEDNHLRFVFEFNRHDIYYVDYDLSSDNE